MPVLINEFEAVAEPAGEPRSEAPAQKSQRRIKPTDVRPALRILALRAVRVRAH